MVVHWVLGDDELGPGGVEVDAAELLVGPVLGGVGGQQDAHGAGAAAGRRWGPCRRPRRPRCRRGNGSGRR